MSLTIVLFTLSIIVLIFATITDLKTREVPDTISYGFIVLAFLVRIFYSFSSGWSQLLYGFFGFVAMLILGSILYYTKQWGGADSKIFMGLGIVFGDLFIFNLPLLLILLLLVLFTGSVYGSVWGLALFFKNKKKTVPLLKRRLKKQRWWGLYAIALGIVLLVASFFTPTYSTRIIFLITAIATGTLYYLYNILRVIEEVCFIQSTPLSKVTEGDWLAEDVIKDRKTVLSNKITCLEKKHLRLLRKNNVKEIKIKVGIPFLPPILIGTLLTIGLYFF